MGGKEERIKERTQENREEQKKMRGDKVKERTRERNEEERIKAGEKERGKRIKNERERESKRQNKKTEMRERIRILELTVLAEGAWSEE